MKVRTITKEELEKLKVSKLGTRIRMIREFLIELYGKENYSASRVANEAGVTPQNILQIEKGKITNPSYKTVIAIAKYFRVHQEIFYDDFYDNLSDIEPFEIGDVSSVASSNSENQSKKSNCVITVVGAGETISEVLEITDVEIRRLLKRIRLEIELIKQGE
ncbi:helix-turn-helix transcriptional regulator [Paenibacillus lycopersici]|uniref:Helix-turn-helix transcriptional regulator n=1 Tax=Paenibacillus lycopersici TaxID=2704462 RepID=A0A6C0FT44_9BACL|nr:helix-turn-helix transcriptional regulator [Paenibacillus lycopersici]QHT58621.1 helix-turn-helix transcriptional regulator [Paenibacillus lycopersici]